MDTAEELNRLTKFFSPPCLLPRQKITMWTAQYMVRPALVKRTFGKGDLLIALYPMMHRPRYYLVWVDADWFDGMSQYVDDIWFGIEDEFGSRDSDDTGPYKWPEVDDQGCCCWRKAVFDDVLTPRARKRLLAQDKGGSDV